MKLGVSYNVFEGEELLEYVLRPIRHLLDHVSVVYQTTSYFGNLAHPDLVPTLQRLQALGLVDEVVYSEPDLTLPPRANETRNRNLGRECSVAAGCTHHITADTDEFYEPGQLEWAKGQMEGYNCSLVGMEMYYKRPEWRIVKNQGQVVPFIQLASSVFDVTAPWVHPVDYTKRCMPCDRCRVFTLDEFTMHHMSYVRSDIRRKLMNNENSKFIQVKKFLDHFDKYELGGRLVVMPDLKVRRTIDVGNPFNIEVP